jgi:hypothetical protein
MSDAEPAGLNEAIPQATEPQATMRYSIIQSGLTAYGNGWDGPRGLSQRRHVTEYGQTREMWSLESPARMFDHAWSRNRGNHLRTRSSTA